MYEKLSFSSQYSYHVYLILVKYRYRQIDAKHVKLLLRNVSDMKFYQKSDFNFDKYIFYV